MEDFEHFEGTKKWSHIFTRTGQEITVVTDSENPPMLADGNGNTYTYRGYNAIFRTPVRKTD